MADGGDGLVRVGEVPDDLQHPLVQADVLWGTPAGYDQRIVVLRLDAVERGVEGEVVARLLTVSLIALEVVDRRAYLLATLFVRADRVHGVAHHLQGLEGHHDLVVLHEVADQHEDLLRAQGSYLCSGIGLMARGASGAEQPSAYSRPGSIGKG